ncbi:AAA family ATPase [Streptomyces triticirhizae]|uniref:ATP-binding protein n=1 Tax=Streptomyces triticirhizae TaxID=2483353 RepID=A0A3M2KZ81_9ACTN|nr:AAA family ATPase [Streptomyces triticirhizae]RMI30762.1 ATP-binding protein [Streptomyces triticirhizae]
MDQTVADAADSRVRDLRGEPGGGPLTLCWPAGHRVLVSGLPGCGKSTLMARATGPGGGPGSVLTVDSQEVRARWDRRLGERLPYAAYRPLVRLAHYLRLWRTLRRRDAVLVHDCGRVRWVRAWLAWHAWRRRRPYDLLLLDVPPEEALAGQRRRGRAVSAYAFRRHRRALSRLLARVEAGRLPPGCGAVVLLDAPVAARATLSFVTPDDAPTATRFPLVERL